MKQQTVLHDEHVKLGAKMVEFAGWDMPVIYTSVMDEHAATRTSAGLFDVSHMAEFRIKGPSAAEFIRKLIPTRLDKLVPGKSMYSALCAEGGGVVDDIFVYMMDRDEYFIVSNAGTHDKDLDWLNAHRIAGVEIIDESPITSKLDLQGPASREILSTIVDGAALGKLGRFGFDAFTFKGATLMIAQSGYTGEFGYELYIRDKFACDLWRTLLANGAGMGLKPAGLGARDTLRLESCLSLYGHELSDTITIVESGLKWLVSSQDEYIGRNILEKQVREGTTRTIVVFEATDKGVPRDGYEVFRDSKKIGYVTSGTFSPTFKKGIGMALVDNGSLSLGDPFDIVIRDRRVGARVVQRPLYKYHG
jgi:aminomethyltransferase